MSSQLPLLTRVESILRRMSSPTTWSTRRSRRRGVRLEGGLGGGERGVDEAVEGVHDVLALVTKDRGHILEG